MMSVIYYGIIKPERLATWKSNRDPYDILENRIDFAKTGGWEFLANAKKILREETAVDWGSFAYKASYQELVALQEKLKCQIPDLEKFDENTEFGVIFVEIN